MKKSKARPKKKAKKLKRKPKRPVKVLPYFKISSSLDIMKDVEERALRDITEQEDRALMKKVDVVNDPQHYGGADNPMEVVKVLIAWGLDKDFFLGNTVKYIARAGKKDPAKLKEDLQKAAYYLQKRIENL